jgi:hypothetical protein
MATKRIKFLHRAKILQSDIEIKIDILGPTKRFTANLNFAAYKFPPDAVIYVDAKQLLERIRFDFGTVGKPKPPRSIDISRLRGERVTFDVLVVDPQNARKLGTAEAVRPLRAGEATSGPRELLPIDASQSLDGVAWKVNYSENWEGASDAPVLLLDKAAARGSAAHFVSNSWVRALVLPSAMREILTRILLTDSHAYEKDSTSWRDSWVRFASREACQEPPSNSASDEGPTDELEGWINLAVSKMATRGQFLKNLLAEPTR